MRKLLVSLMILLFILAFLSGVYFDINSRDNSEFVTHTLYLPVFLIPLFAIAITISPKNTVAKVINLCNSSAHYEKRSRGIEKYLSDELILSGETERLLKWKPGKTVELKSGPAANNEKVVSSKQKDGSTYVFCLKKRESGGRRKAAYWLVYKIDNKDRVEYP